MKNIHLLPTEKQSRLSRDKNNRNLFINTSKDFLFNAENLEYLNICITNDEEIKEGDWLYVKTPNIYGGNVIAKSLGNSNGCWADYILTETTDEKGYHPSHCKKIILTTDQSLEGVQAISDEFLEWFVKNPSCEEVEVEKTFVTNSGLGYQEYAILDSDFKVLEVVANIPQSSYKIGEVTKLDGYEYITEYKIIIPQEETKKEKDLAYWKENAEEDYMKVPISVLRYITELEERMYSEEDLREAFENGVGSGKYQEKYGDNARGSMSFEYFIEQLKNK